MMSIFRAAMHHASCVDGGSHCVPHLDLGTAGAHSQDVAFLDPGHGGDVVVQAVHLEQRTDVPGAGVPQVQGPAQRHRQVVVRRPVQ